MKNDDNIQKLENFFEYDLKVKKILNDIIPREENFYNDDYKFKYIDKLLDSLDKINVYINKMMLDYSFSKDVIIEFNKVIEKLRNDINSDTFYRTSMKNYSSALNFVHTNISDMRGEFVDSVNKGFKGYCLFYGSGVLLPNTINEFLHYVHSYVINNEQFYSSIPIIESKNNGITLRGVENEKSIQLYDDIISQDLDSDMIDIISLEKRILIMARDLGHATVIEVDMSDPENYFVKYFIPKNTNREMTSILKGININDECFATGEFQTVKENFTNDLCTLMKGIPTDLDMKIRL